MADRPMIFSAPMVRALLEGRKTQTRRVQRDVPDPPEPDCHPQFAQRHEAPYLDSYCSERKNDTNPRGMSHWWNWWQVDDRMCLPQFRVPFAPGDRIWVREAWRACYQLDGIRPAQMSEYEPRRMEADGALIEPTCMMVKPGRYRHARFMPRWASRLTLHVTDVRVQRLQDISEADCIAEGVSLSPNRRPNYRVELPQRNPFEADAADSDRARSCFMRLWQSLHGPDVWDANPWVAALNFEVERVNIDQARSA